MKKKSHEPVAKTGSSNSRPSSERRRVLLSWAPGRLGQGPHLRQPFVADDSPKTLKMWRMKVVFLIVSHMERYSR